MIDFGLEIPSTLAMAKEGWEYEELTLLNAGVMLMNVPQMRMTRTALIEYIEKKSKNGEHFDLGPMDQGAYKDFYHLHKNQLERLHAKFNVKPYWPRDLENKDLVIHFHGAKAHDYIKAFYYRHTERPLNFSSSPTINGFFEKLNDEPTENNICPHMKQFVTIVQSGELAETVCKNAFDKNSIIKPKSCISALRTMKSSAGDYCYPNFDTE